MHGGDDVVRPKGGGRGEDHRIDVGGNHPGGRVVSGEDRICGEGAPGRLHHRLGGRKGLIGKGVADRRDHDATVRSRLEGGADAAASAADQSDPNPVAAGGKTAAGNDRNGGGRQGAFEEGATVDPLGNAGRSHGEGLQNEERGLQERRQCSTSRWSRAPVAAGRDAVWRIDGPGAHAQRLSRNAARVQVAGEKPTGAWTRAGPWP